MNFNKNRPPRKAKKKGKNEPQLVTQEDFYIEATQQEEQAERWILSDIKKTLRFYIQASELYSQALNNSVEATDAGRYNILYNQTRLYLVVYTEYLAVNGYINVLSYLNNLEELVGLDSIILTLPDIIARFESVLQEFQHNTDSASHGVPVSNFWDLKFNLLTCYLLLAESVNDEGANRSTSASGEDVIELVQNKFIPCFKELVTEITGSLNDWNEIQKSTQQELFENGNYQRDNLQDQHVNNGGDGIKLNNDESSQQNETGLMEVSDQVTPETLAETYVIAYKFIETIMGLILDARYKPQSSVLNQIQANFMEDTVKQFMGQVNEFVSQSEEQYGIDTSDISVSSLSLNGTTMILEGNVTLQTMDEFLTTEINSAAGSAQSSENEQYTKMLMVKNDLLELMVSLIEDRCTDPTIVEQLWSLTSSLSKNLGIISKTLNEKRTSIISGKYKSQSGQLSSTVFHQCDVIINSSDNELRRAWILEVRDNLSGNTGASLKTIEILHKNAKTLLTNAMKISERPCGLEECIIDKLKRNYIFNQARGRSALLTDGTLPQTPTTTDLLDQISDHPFYKSMM
ncbi:hypothetical protein RNJ44_04326 [Nakaseomyces bracarensis]|uniref:Uncharacterized protein n=1 Tax=Nakaseomyces bracarensis TaxID=273131 RepID=A0ABR4NUL2_9SACH